MRIVSAIERCILNHFTSSEAREALENGRTHLMNARLAADNGDIESALELVGMSKMEARRAMAAGAERRGRRLLGEARAFKQLLSIDKIEGDNSTGAERRTGRAQRWLAKTIKMRVKRDIRNYHYASVYKTYVAERRALQRLYRATKNPKVEKALARVVAGKSAFMDTMRGTVNDCFDTVYKEIDLAEGLTGDLSDSVQPTRDELNTIMWHIDTARQHKDFLSRVRNEFYEDGGTEKVNGEKFDTEKIFGRLKDVDERIEKLEKQLDELNEGVLKKYYELQIKVIENLIGTMVTEPLKDNVARYRQDIERLKKELDVLTETSNAYDQIVVIDKESAEIKTYFENLKPEVSHIARGIVWKIDRRTEDISALEHEIEKRIEMKCRLEKDLEEIRKKQKNTGDIAAPALEEVAEASGVQETNSVEMNPFYDTMNMIRA